MNLVLALGGALVGGGLLFAMSRQTVAETTAKAPVNVDGYFQPNGSVDMDTGFNKMVESISRARGIRNNNPGNLIMTMIQWNGKVPWNKNTDGKFEQFIEPIYGIRAMFMDVRGDIEKDGLNTIRKLITEYAPPKKLVNGVWVFENDTEAYISSVTRTVGIGANDLIKPAHYLKLLKAIILHENGEQPYSDSLISQAMALA